MSHDQEESKLNSIIIITNKLSNDAHTLADDEIIKSPFNKNKFAAI